MPDSRPSSRRSPPRIARKIQNERQGETFGSCRDDDSSCWTRLSSTKWEDAWIERLRFLGPEKTAFITWPGPGAQDRGILRRTRSAKDLVRRFGGRVTKLAAYVWTGDPSRPRGPLSIRGKLKVFSDRPSWRNWRKSGRKPIGIFVPAGMAFGTGEHATTATCLRLLADLSDHFPSGGFAALDLVQPARGFLPSARRLLELARSRQSIAIPSRCESRKRNAAANRFPSIRISRGDVLELVIRPRFDAVLANLFSDVLVASASRIARATKPGGWLVFSLGVLRTQRREVISAFQAAGFTKPRVIVRGKWCAGTCRRNG